MRWTVVIPGALVPSAIAADVLAGAATPWLATALARAHSESAGAEAGSAPHLTWLWKQFGGAGEPVTAPYALRALDADADLGAQCWHVDPLHFVFAREYLLVAPLGEPLTAADETALAAHLREALRGLEGDASPVLHAHRGHWLLTLAQPWAIRASPLEAALGKPAHEHWPQGDDAGTWRRLLTEVQMRWHDEPVNEAREVGSKNAANALWLHGGGAWARLPRQPFEAVVGADPVLRGWGLASGLERAALHDEGVLPPRGEAVSIRRELLEPAQFESWGQWLDRLAQLEQSLRRLHESCFAAGYDELALVLFGRQQVRIVRLRRGDAWRLWRRAPLAPLLAEAS
jgi:hypothetical protein